MRLHLQLYLQILWIITIMSKLCEKLWEKLCEKFVWEKKRKKDCSFYHGITLVVIPASDELIHVLLLSFLNYFMTGSHPPVYKTSLYLHISAAHIHQWCEATVHSNIERKRQLAFKCSLDQRIQSNRQRRVSHFDETGTQRGQGDKLGWNSRHLFLKCQRINIPFTHIKGGTTAKLLWIGVGAK
jgi:hypothetical protein